MPSNATIDAGSRELSPPVNHDVTDGWRSSATPLVDAATYYAACETEGELTAMRKRLELIGRVIKARENGLSLTDIASATWLSAPSLSRLLAAWKMAEESGNPRLLLPGKSSGRPSRIRLSEASAAYLRKQYVKSNHQTGLGSMTAAARYAATNKKDDNPLTPDERRAILDCGSSKHRLPVSVRRAMRGADAVVADYRDPRTRQLGGLYAPGTVRMTEDEETGELRRVYAGERWCGDDGSVNFCVCVPWPWGGDPCSDRFGVRVGRYQLLAVVDVASDKCLAWQYTMRDRDSYRSEDVVALYESALRFCGYKPRYMVSEGGAWQALRTLEFLARAGIEMIDVKGRPHQKVIEPWFGRMWTALSMRTEGQIGRYRGEMRRETELMQRCRSGTVDPRRVFPSLAEAMNAIEWCVGYVNADLSHSKIYGTRIPNTYHAAGLAEHPRAAYSDDLGFLSMRVREKRVVRRFGMVGVSAESPLGFERVYHFGGEELIPFNRAKIWVHFDPMAPHVDATITLAEDFQDHRAGLIVARNMPCLNAAPEMVRDDAGIWGIRFSDGVGATMRAKKMSRLAVRREMRAIALDGNRMASVSQASAPDVHVESIGIGTVEQATQAAEDAVDRNALPKILSRAAMVAS